MEEHIENLTFAVVGMGLIGGSYAKRLTKLGTRVIGINRSKKTLEKALADGAIAKAGEEFLSEADLVIFATPEAVTENFIRGHLSDFKKGAVLTDAAGVKTGGAARILDFLPDTLDFLSAHPMAGREGAGYGQARADIFVGRNYLLVPEARNRAESVTLVRRLALALGCAHVEEISREEHDRIIAYTSDMPHAVAASIMNSRSMEARMKHFVAGGFLDVTRIADINSRLWTELFMDNRENLLAEIRRFNDALADFTDALERRDEEKMMHFLSASRERRSGMNGNDPRRLR